MDINYFELLHIIVHCSPIAHFRVCLMKQSIHRFDILRAEMDQVSSGVPSEFYLTDAFCNGDLRSIREIMHASLGHYWCDGIFGACDGGHWELIDMVVANDDSDIHWDDGLSGACNGGQYDVADFVIREGTRRSQEFNWNNAKTSAYVRGYHDIVALLEHYAPTTNDRWLEFAKRLIFMRDNDEIPCIM